MLDGDVAAFRFGLTVAGRYITFHLYIESTLGQDLGSTAC